METSRYLEINKQSWEKAAPRFFGRTALPEYGPHAPSETELRLFGDVSGMKVLDIGCGSGHSLKYMAERGAAELWGLDLAKKQLETAAEVLGPQYVTERFFESPMERDPGLPRGYFDIAYSIYALGWTVDLAETLSNIHHYLKPGGIFIFSWEHPLHSRVELSEKGIALRKPYHEEGPAFHEKWQDNPVVLFQRKTGTYVNALSEAGFKIERLIEDAAPDLTSDNPRAWYSYLKAEVVPATIVFKCVKL